MYWLETLVATAVVALCLFLQMRVNIYVEVFHSILTEVHLQESSEMTYVPGGMQLLGKRLCLVLVVRVLKT